jgi:uncharacterized protein YjbI with pentapeptide repeats
MPPTGDEDKVKSAWEAFHLDRDLITALPTIVRTWTTIAIIIALISSGICVAVSIALLVRLGWDALSLQGTAYQEAAKNFLFAFAGAFGAPFLVWRTWVAHKQATAAVEQARVALDNHITGIFSKSVELLGLVREVKTVGIDGTSIARSIPNIESRLGALYSLERLLNESEKDQRAILETLCAYVRENSPLQIPDDEGQREELSRGNITPAHTRRSDVQAAITIIGRRPAQVKNRAEREGWRLDFRDTNLVGYDFSKLNFDRSDFTYSFLNSAKLVESSFVNCIFASTVLCSAEMNSTCLRSSDFKNCNVKKAEIDKTDFSFSKIENTDLREAKVISFNISGANLENAFGTYLAYVVDDIKKNGVKHSFNVTEIIKTVELFKKAIHDEQTNVSQAVHDAIRLMSTEPSSDEAKRNPEQADPQHS